MTDPYKVLEISPDATDDEVKKAYREKAKKYHPDNYANTEFSDIANEKMKSINEAYDAILKERASGTRRTAGPSDQSRRDPRWSEVRRLIESGRYTEAEVLLDQDPIGSAEWFYLKGLCAMYAHRYNDAEAFFSRANSLDPTNQEYAAMHRHFHRTGRGYSFGDAGGSDCCNMCSALLCADCMCEMCGGDLIGCC